MVFLVLVHHLALLLAPWCDVGHHTRRYHSGVLQVGKLHPGHVEEFLGTPEIEFLWLTFASSDTNSYECHGKGMFFTDAGRVQRAYEQRGRPDWSPECKALPGALTGHGKAGCRLEGEGLPYTAPEMNPLVHCVNMLDIEHIYYPWHAVRFSLSPRET